MLFVKLAVIYSIYKLIQFLMLLFVLETLFQTVLKATKDITIVISVRINSMAMEFVIMNIDLLTIVFNTTNSKPQFVFNAKTIIFLLFTEINVLLRMLLLIVIYILLLMIMEILFVEDASQEAMPKTQLLARNLVI